MENFNNLLRKIVDKKEYLWLAKFHIVSVSLGFMSLSASIIVFLLITYTGETTPLLETLGEIGLLFGFESSVLGFGAIAARAMIVREISFVSGHLENPTFFYDGKALFVGVFLACIAIVSQIIVTYALADILLLY